MLKHSRILALFALMLSMALLPACGDDDSSMNPGASLQGTWLASSFSAGGTDYVPSGLTVTLTFTTTTYVLDVSGDNNGVICDMMTECINTGTLSSTGTTVTFDPGTADELTLNYTVTATMLTLSGSIDATALSAVFVRI